MRKIAIIASVWLAATVTLAFGAYAFGDEHGSNGGDQHRSHCEYEHGVLQCDD